LDFSNTTLTTGSLIRVGATMQSVVDENTRFIFRNFQIIGPHTTTITASDVPQTSLIGVSFEFALGCNISNVAIKSVHTGVRATFSFPFYAENVSTDNCYVGLKLEDDMTLGTWVSCQFKGGRFGIVAQPTVNTKQIVGQTFIRPNVESNEVGVVLDPLSGSGVGVHGLNFIEPYMEGINLDGFRMGRAWNSTDAAITGASQTRSVYNVTVSGGTWPEEWGQTGHQPFLFQDTDSGNVPHGIRLHDIPIDFSRCEIGFIRKSIISNVMDVQLGSTTLNATHYIGSFIEMDEMTAPAAGATNTARLYAEDNGSGKTRLVVRFPTGAAQVIATEP
jgi:hypothetical protein